MSFAASSYSLTLSSKYWLGWLIAGASISCVRSETHLREALLSISHVQVLWMLALCA